MARKILIVEDDSELIELVQLALSRRGYEYMSTSYPADVLAMAREFLPDAILLDYALPDMDGFEIMRWLRSDPALRPIPIIFWSGRDRSFFDHVLIPENDPIGFLRKPHGPSELLAILDEFLGDE